MASWIEIDRIRKDPEAIRSLAKRLLKLPDHDWTEWEVDFLEDRSRQKDEINTRQAEKLLELRDEAEYLSKAEGFSVASLVENCWLARDDLHREFGQNIHREPERTHGAQTPTAAEAFFMQPRAQYH